MLRESLLECHFSQANVAFTSDIVACGNLCFVYDVAREAMVVQWAFVFVLTVACLFHGHGGVVAVTCLLCLLMIRLHVFYTVVAYLCTVSV